MMATLLVWWQLSIFFIATNNRVLAANFLLSKPRCFTPCDQICQADIHCFWDPWPNHSASTNYTLHWETAHHIKDHVNARNLSGIIRREKFTSHSQLSVWVQAAHQNGSAESQRSVFNTGKIKKPPAPNITSIQRDPLEIHWDLTCKKLHLHMRSCEVRYRAETENDWTKTELGSSTSYESHHIMQPGGLIYEFQVRCACSSGLMSDWSRTARITSQEMTPEGKLDVWSDCEVSRQKLSCVLMWKKPPKSQARGEILVYEVSHGGNLYNISTAQPGHLLVCDETKCYLNISITSSANISAYNSVGATVPAYIQFPLPGKENDREALKLQMNTEKLDVWWSLTSPSHLSDEYVVQYKQVGQPLGLGFDWIREKGSRGSKTFKDQFRKYTPYKVSLYSVSQEGTSRHYSSVVAYSRQTTPPRVPTFRVIKIEADSVTLFWEPIPLPRQNGNILFYQIGGATSDVHNVSALPHHGNKTFELKHLSPGRDYKVWIKAVTAAGPGENASASFKTKHQKQTAPFVLTLLVSSLLIVAFGAWILVRASQGGLSCPMFLDKNIPDPHDSHILKQLKNQMNDNSAWLLTTLGEPHPVISTLEVVETKTFSNGSLKTFNLDEQVEDSSGQECQSTDQRSKKEGYSQMPDSDGEQGKELLQDEEERWSSSEEDFTSGYEKHFMPTPQELLGC